MSLAARLTYATALGALLAYFVVANVAMSRSGGMNPIDSSDAPVELATSTDASYNWSGYVADEGTYTAVSATWVVPQARYPAGAIATVAADATWVGIGGVDSHDLIQAGTQALVDSGGHTQYQAWYELLPDVSQPVELEIEPGDSVSVAVTYVGNGRWHVSFVDNTTGKRADADVAYDSSFSSAEWIEEMPSLALGRGRASMPLDDFGRVTMLNASAVKDDKPIALGEVGAQPLKMQNGLDDTLAAPSVISGAGNFSIVRGSAAATPRRGVHIIIIGP